MNNPQNSTKPEALKFALIQAADGDQNGVKDLLRNGADPNGMPLMMAIQCDEPDIVQMMIDVGAEINIHFAGTTPLIRAIQGCHLAVIKVLLESGADVNLKDEKGQTPLAHAKGRIRLDATRAERDVLVKTLLDAGAQE